MAHLQGIWTKLQASTNPELQRSSHCVSVIDDTAFVFGGELRPREPRDNDVFSVQLLDSVETNTIEVTGQKPTPRVGAATTSLGGKLYVFGGRGGVAMTSLEENGCFWCLDTAKANWSQIGPENDSDQPVPEGRSYHAMTSDGVDTIYLHAGCPATGRLADLWSFYVPSRKWKKLAPAPDPPRGGTSICWSGSRLYRMNGFDGKTEQGGSVDVYDPKADAWKSVRFEADGKQGPEARSVACLLPLTIDGEPCLVTMFGEHEPSDLGHAGAGRMLGDVWVYDIMKESWNRLRDGDTEEKPVARGWFDADVASIQGKHVVVVHGGLDDANERRGDIWTLKIEE